MNTIYRDGKVKIPVDADPSLLAKAVDWALANKPLIQAEWDKLNGA